ncbi:MAG: T9SS type A sorting domain-containing protein [Saprospiraceae bacterium]
MKYQIHTISLFVFFSLSFLDFEMLALNRIEKSSLDSLPEIGEVVNIFRMDGVGAGSKFLDMTASTRENILQGNFDGSIEYIGSRAPIKVKVTDPAKIQNKTFDLELHDEDDSDARLEEPISWILKNVNNPSEIYYSNQNISVFNEQEIPELGISISIVQGLEPGNNEDFMGDSKNGILGYEEVYSNPAGPKWLSGQNDEAYGLFNMIDNSPGGEDYYLDPTQAYSNIGPGYFFPLYALNHRDLGQNYFRISPMDFGTNAGLTRNFLRNKDLNNVDLVFTKDKSLWTRCPVTETTTEDLTQLGFTSEGNRFKFLIRDALSVGKEDLDGDGLADIDGDGKGMAWFPGYAIDIETGNRLNIMFGEASVYNYDEPLIQSLWPDCENTFQDEPLTGADMMWNPTSSKMLPDPDNDSTASPFWRYIMGGQHFIYILKTTYDEGQWLRQYIDPEETASPLLRVRALRDITWCGFPIVSAGTSLLSYADGLIPNDLIIKLRADNPFDYNIATGINGGRPTYRFTLNNFISATKKDPDWASRIKVFPNPVSKENPVIFLENIPLDAEIEIRDINGRLKEKLNPEGQESKSFLLKNNYPEGTYLLVLKHKNFAPKGMRFVVY